MKEKFNNIISSLHLRISDLFLAIGFIPMAIFLINGQLFMQHQDPADVALRIETIIPLFVILLLCWGCYIFLEFKRNGLINKSIIIFVILAIVGVIGIFVQPTNFEINMIRKDGEAAIASLNISLTHRLFFTFDLISILLFIYIGLFIFPKRFKNVLFLQVICWIVILSCFVLIVYSYIIEHDNYSLFIKSLIDGDFELINVYAVKSFIIHKNAFGMTLLIGIICCFINHSIKAKWWLFPIIIYFYMSMFFTFCKTSMILSPIITLIYVFYYLISTMKISKIKSIVWLSIISFIFVLFGGLALLILIDKGNNFPKLYNVISSLSDNRSIGSREWIWNNTYYLMSEDIPLSLFFGRGFGLMNEMLLPMNLINWDTPLSFPTHSGYLNLFAEGGFLYLFAYLALLGYSIYIVYKSFKKNPSTTIAIALGLFSFVFYSLIETIHYLTYVFMFVLFAFYNIVSRTSNTNQQ